MIHIELCDIYGQVGVYLQTLGWSLQPQHSSHTQYTRGHLTAEVSAYTYTDQSWCALTIQSPSDEHNNLSYVIVHIELWDRYGQVGVYLQTLGSGWSLQPQHSSHTQYTHNHLTAEVGAYIYTDWSRPTLTTQTTYRP